MSYLVLARKYRPQLFDEVVGQEHVTKTLKNAISAQRVAHAILFSGPRGTGKTTIARILAKAMNCKKGPTATPCNQCTVCTEITAGGAADVFEIDGASNNSVDQVRELRENIRYMPVHSVHKIYIIDEVHMLSTAAFNALLKTLEEPPAHVLFFFATTEPHKIPITILSRCQRYDLRRIEIEVLVAQMLEICGREEFSIPPESLKLIACEAGGSMRDALSMLDQILSVSQQEVTHESVMSLLGVIDRNRVLDAAFGILGGDAIKTLTVIDQVYVAGQDVKRFYSNILSLFRDLLVLKMTADGQKLVSLPVHEIEMLKEKTDTLSEQYLSQIFEHLFKAEVTIRLSPHPKLAMEMIMMQLLQIKPVIPLETLVEHLDSLRQSVTSSETSTTRQEHIIEEGIHQINSKDAASLTQKSISPEASAAKDIALPKESMPAQQKPSPEEPTGDIEGSKDAAWEGLMKIIALRHPVLCANLKYSSLSKMEDAGLEIEVGGSRFNYNRLQRPENISRLRAAGKAFFGREIDVRLTLSEKIQSGEPRQLRDEEARLKQTALQHPLVGSAIEVFNGKVVNVKLIK